MSEHNNEWAAPYCTTCGHFHPQTTAGCYRTVYQGSAEPIPTGIAPEGNLASTHLVDVMRDLRERADRGEPIEAALRGLLAALDQDFGDLDRANPEDIVDEWRIRAEDALSFRVPTTEGGQG